MTAPDRRRGPGATTSPGPRCLTCVYSRPITDPDPSEFGYRWCVRYPPAVTPMLDGDHTVWPQVHDDAWCGEHSTAVRLST